MNVASQSLPEHQPQRLLNTVESSCTRLGIKRTTMFRLLKENRIKAVKIGTRTMIAEAELKRFVASLGEQA